MARCSKCGAEAEATVKFCPDCGRKFIPVAPPVDAGETGLYYCFRHKRSATRVTCGRCEKPICDRCMIVGANGVRCLECARNKTPVRLSGVAYDIFSGIGRGLGGSRGWPIWYYVAILFLARVLFGFFSCR